MTGHIEGRWQQTGRALQPTTHEADPVQAFKTTGHCQIITGRAEQWNACHLEKCQHPTLYDLSQVVVGC